MKLGLLRCLLFYPLGPFWETFFAELGFSVVVSPVSTRETFDQTRRRFSGDICLPVESAASHLLSLGSTVDLVFIPKLTDRRDDLYICPVCAGLPFVIEQSFPEAPPLLSIQLTPFSPPGREATTALAAHGCSSKSIAKAYASACHRYSEMEYSWTASHVPALHQKRILLLGMPYVVSDPLIHAGLPDILSKRNCHVSTALNIAPQSAFNRVYVEGYPLYWAFAGMSVHALSLALQTSRPDGVLYLSSFACGVDSVVVPIVQSVCRRCEDLPFLLLTVDEHASAAHMEVRVEAFLDCIEADIRRKRAQT